MCPAKLKPPELSVAWAGSGRFFFVELGFDRGLDLLVELWIVLQRFLGRVASLRQLRALVIQPGTAFLDDLFLQRQIEQRASRRNAFVVHDVELGFGKRRRDLVLYYF